MSEIMEFMDELKELCHKGEQIVHKMQQGSFGQRKYGRYGMRDNQGGYDGGYGGSYGQRWEGQPMHGDYQMRGGYPDQHWQDINPMMFM
jgi:hypothetical protein